MANAPEGSSTEDALVATRRAKAESSARAEKSLCNDVVPKNGGTTVDISELRARAWAGRSEDGKYAEERVKDATKGGIFHVRGRSSRFARRVALSFLKLRDRTGEIQLLVSEGAMAADAYAVSTRSTSATSSKPKAPTASKRGELSIEPAAWHPHEGAAPAAGEWHGLQDVETRYRQRYVDLIANPPVADVFRARSLIVRATRKVFDDSGFLEVETPRCTP